MEAVAAKTPKLPMPTNSSMRNGCRLVRVDKLETVAENLSFVNVQAGKGTMYEQV